MINRESVAGKMKKNYFTLLKPEGIGMGSMLRSDPLGLSMLVINKLKFLSESMGYTVNVEDGHFISGDGRHAMIIATTSVSATDTAGCKRLFDDLNEKIRKLPSYVSAITVSGHAHSLSNERVMKRDIALTSSVATVVFILLFLFAFKDFRAVLIFIIPLMTIFQAVYLCYLLLGELSYSVVGLATMLAGVSADYGIQVYVAARNKENPAERVKRILLPTLIGAVTTFAVFFAFLFSTMDGYRQLGYMTMFGLALAFIFSFLIIPHFVSKKSTPLLEGERLEHLNIKGRYIIGLWAVPTLILLALAFTVRFDNNIYKIDGTEPAILQEEAQFRQIWGQNKTAVFIAQGETLEQALQQNDAIYKEALGIDGLRFSSLSALLPSDRTRQENFERWKQFWKQGKADQLKKLIEDEGLRYGFTKEAFSPFFENLYRENRGPGITENNDFISKLQERFIYKVKNGYQVLSFFPDEDRYADALYKISKHYKGAFVVSPGALSNRISIAVYSDVIMMTGLAASLVILFTYLYFRNIRELLLALVPVVTSIAWMFGVMAIFDIAFNLSTLITGIALMGICVDYGIFMVYKCRSNSRAGIVMAVFLSAVATIIGTGVLILARHPALFYIGLTMTIGLVTGCLSSLFVIPYLYRVAFRQGKEERV
jgi:predicted exporter